MKKKYQNNKNCSLHSVRSAEYYKGYNSAVSDINKDDHSARAHTHTHTHTWQVTLRTNMYTTQNLIQK